MIRTAPKGRWQVYSVPVEEAQVQEGSLTSPPHPVRNMRPGTWGTGRVQVWGIWKSPAPRESGLGKHQVGVVCGVSCTTVCPGGYTSRDTSLCLCTGRSARHRGGAAGQFPGHRDPLGAGDTGVQPAARRTAAPCMPVGAHGGTGVQSHGFKVSGPVPPRAMARESATHILFTELYFNSGTRKKKKTITVI